MILNCISRLSSASFDHNARIVCRWGWSLQDNSIGIHFAVLMTRMEAIGIWNSLSIGGSGLVSRRLNGLDISISQSLSPKSYWILVGSQQSRVKIVGWWAWVIIVCHGNWGGERYRRSQWSISFLLLHFQIRISRRSSLVKIGVAFSPHILATGFCFLKKHRKSQEESQDYDAVHYAHHKIVNILKPFFHWWFHVTLHNQCGRLKIIYSYRDGIQNTEIGKKAWLFAKLQPGKVRKIINAT